MSARNLDKHNRFRCITVGFRVSPEEHEHINKAVAMSGLSKQEYCYRRCLGRDIVVQGKRDPSTAELSFMNSEWLQSHGIEPKYENYELIYTGALTQDGSQIDKLEDLYRIFNIEHPQDFTGHSLSISDIVALKQAGVVSYHYVDSIGYKELTNFRNTDNHLKNAEMQMEDDFGMIDGVINNAPKEPVKAPAPKKEETKTKKPSVLAKLRQYQEEDRKATTQHRSAERDLSDTCGRDIF